MGRLPETDHLLRLGHLSSLNRRKILSKNVFAFLFALLTALSFYNLSSVMDGYLAEGRYEITDGTEYRLIYAEENLTGSKVSEIAKKYGELDLPTDIGRVTAADVRVARMTAQVYGWDFAALDESGALSDERFYGDRAAAIAVLDAGGDANGGTHPAEPDTGAFGPAYPITLGYAEGWRNVNAGMGSCVRIVLMIVFLTLVPVFNEDRTRGVDDLVRSTRHGRAKLDRIRIVNALQLSALIYAAAVALYVIPIFIVYGPHGAALPIQGDPLYFLSSANLSFLGQFAVNLLVGALAVVGMAGIALIVSLIISDAFTGYAALLFIAAVSYLIDMLDLSGFKHFLWNFTPVGMTDFSAYYAGHDTYFGIPSVLFVPFAAVAAVCAEYLLLFVLLRKRHGWRVNGDAEAEGVALE
jgi:hypothetical protein